MKREVRGQTAVLTPSAVTDKSETFTCMAVLFLTALPLPVSTKERGLPRPGAGFTKIFIVVYSSFLSKEIAVEMNAISIFAKQTIVGGSHSPAGRDVLGTQLTFLQKYTQTTRIRSLTVFRLRLTCATGPYSLNRGDSYGTRLCCQSCSASLRPATADVIDTSRNAAARAGRSRSERGPQMGSREEAADRSIRSGEHLYADD